MADTPQRMEMAPPRAAWLAAAAHRRSRRSFEDRPVDAATLDSLTRTCAHWRPYPDARVVLVADPDVDVFTGIIGSYGRVTGAPHLLLFIADERSPNADQHLGYAGEGVILEATHLGLETCWVAGFFSARKTRGLVELAPGERIHAVSPLGHALVRDSRNERVMASLAHARKRKSVAEITHGADLSAWPGWAIAALECVRLAPSAMNRQPWRFRFEGGGLIATKDSPREVPKVTKRLDIGIAMLHAELGAAGAGVLGSWTDLKGVDCARFDPVG